MRALPSWLGNWLVRYARRHAARAHERMLQLCEPVPGGVLLDVGCGDGAFTARVSQKVGAARSIGIDVLPENVDALRARKMVGIRANLDKGFPLSNESVGVVVASHIIEHVSDTDLFVKEMYRVLRGGGYAIVATPNLAALYNILFLMLGKQPPVTSVSDVVAAGGNWDQALLSEYRQDVGGSPPVFPRHRRVFTRGSLVGLLQYYGLKVEKTAVSGFPPLPWFLADMACRVLPMYAWNIIVRSRKPV